MLCRGENRLLGLPWMENELLFLFKYGGATGAWAESREEPDP